MSQSEAKRQKKLAKKRAKDKVRHKEIALRKQMLVSGIGQMLTGSQGEIVGCFRCDPKGGYEGLIPVVLIRRTSDGMMAMASFMIDFWCLGVKNCTFHFGPPSEITAMKEHLAKTMVLNAIEPSTGRAMVELGVDFANSFGIRPHSDYQTGKLLWGDIPTGTLPDDIEFGVNGKPRYVSGPFDSANRQAEILELLETHVGTEDFEFVAHAGVHELTDIQQLDVD